MTAIGRDWSKFAPSSVTAVGAPMDLRKLKTLIDLVSESNVSELEITEAEGKVRIVKNGAAMLSQHTPPAMPPPPPRPPPPPPPPPPARRGRGGGPPPRRGGGGPPPAISSSRPWWARFTDRRAPAPRPLSKWAARSRRARPSASSRP